MIEITILNWDKFNPRSDIKRPNWFRFENSFFEDWKFYDMNAEERVAWIYLLCEACRRNEGGKVSINEHHFAKATGCVFNVVNSLITKLKKFNVLDHSTLRGRYARVRDPYATVRDGTGRNGTERDAATSEVAPAPPMIAHPAIFSEGTQDILEKTDRGVQDAWVQTYEDPEWIKQELKKAWSWCKANKAKEPKSNWSRFINNWLSRSWDQHRKTLQSNTPARKSISEILGKENIS